MHHVVWVLNILGQEVFVKHECQRVRSLKPENALKHVANGGLFVSVVQPDEVLFRNVEHNVCPWNLFSVVLLPLKRKFAGACSVSQVYGVKFDKIWVPSLVWRRG